MSRPSWRERLIDRTDPALTEEIDAFESQLELRRQGKLDEALFAELRLRRGVYGQRYDNGQRHDGVARQTLPFPSGALTKGPATLWDAPGMVRIKIPYGRVTAEQLEAMADLAEEYADGILHATTRQDFQLHFVHIEDTPDLMRRLAAVGVTTREACGNAVRNVTACSMAGVCLDERFDVTPYAGALARFLLGHPDAQDFGRKFKVAFSGCGDQPCALTNIHDLGFIAATRRDAAGAVHRGFEVVVGGGLGAVPHQAKRLAEFVPVEELLPLAQAICRVFCRLGEKKNRARARLKFLVAKIGLETFAELVAEERRRLPPDPRWTAELPDVSAEPPARAVAPWPVPAADVEADADAVAFAEWRSSNVRRQRQAGFVAVTVTLPLGDLSAEQARVVALLARRYQEDAPRITIEQNLLMRWVPRAELAAVYGVLAGAGLHRGGANTIADVTACPGTDTCKLGIASSRGLAAELQRRLLAARRHRDQAVRDLRIKISGCFNSCGQHQVADLGFYGVSRKVGGYAVPHFQVVLGGQWAENGGSFGLAIGAVPAKQIPEVIERITGTFVEQRLEAESFQRFVRRVGKSRLKALLAGLVEVPPHAIDPSFYRDWGDAREYTIGDIGKGECAGAVVSPVAFGLAESERVVFEAQLLLDEVEPGPAACRAYEAMLCAAKTLVRVEERDIGDEADRIVEAFRRRYYDTRRFFDPFAGGKFAHYLFAAHRRRDDEATSDDARQRVEQAQLFIEAAHACYARMESPPAPDFGPKPPNDGRSATGGHQR